MSNADGWHLGELQSSAILCHSTRHGLYVAKDRVFNLAFYVTLALNCTFFDRVKG